MGEELIRHQIRRRARVVVREPGVHRRQLLAAVSVGVRVRPRRRVIAEGVGVGHAHDLHRGSARAAVHLGCDRDTVLVS